MLPASPLIFFLNHLLKSASWAPPKLAPFVGSILQFHSGPFDLRLRVTDAGLMEPVADDLVPALVIEMPPLAAARLFAGDQAARREARISGDQALAETVAMIVDNLKWDVEEDLSRVVGDIAAHRLSEGLSTLMTWQRSAAESVGRNLTEYWVEEDPLIASRHRVAQFADSVDQLRDDVERLSRRIDLLQRARD